MFREDVKNIHEKVLKENDPEAWERISHFTFEEVQDDVDLPNKTKLISNLAYLLGMQGLEESHLSFLAFFKSVFHSCCSLFWQR